jgi:hypothetical protein
MIVVLQSGSRLQTDLAIGKHLYGKYKLTGERLNTTALDSNSISQQVFRHNTLREILRHNYNRAPASPERFLAAH